MLSSSWGWSSEWYNVSFISEAGGSRTLLVRIKLLSDPNRGSNFSVGALEYLGDVGFVHEDELDVVLALIR